MMMPSSSREDTHHHAVKDAPGNTRPTTSTPPPPAAAAAAANLHHDPSLEKIQETFLGQHFFKEENDGTKRPNDNDFYLSSLLAQEFTKLTMKEREKSYEELHGVDELIEETPELVATSLKALEDELDRILLFSSKNDKLAAYCIAEQQNKDYVTDPGLRLCFLRADRFDPCKAARRIVAFFEGKLQYFGETLLTKRIQFEDLDSDDQACLKEGHMQVLPSRDRGGRAIFCDINMINDSSYKRPINRLKAFLYMILTLALDDEENQKRGIVVVLMQLGHVNPTEVNRELAKESPRILKWVPIRLSGLHFCMDDPFLSILARISLVGSPPDIRARHRLHIGARTEIKYSLMTYGIPVDLLPLSDQGDIIKKTNHNRWIARHKSKESSLYRIGSNTFSGIVIDLPTRQDILIGKGKPFQEHFGNVKLRALVDDHLEEYNTTKRGSKGDVINKVLDSVKSSGSRFLGKQNHNDNDDDNNNNNNNGWWWVEVSDTEATEKVAKTFLSACAKSKRTTADHKDTSNRSTITSSTRQQQQQQGSSGPSSWEEERNSTFIFQPEKRRKFDG